MEDQEDCRLDTEKKKKKYLCMCLFIEIYRRENSLEAQEDCRLDTEKKKKKVFMHVFIH